MRNRGWKSFARHDTSREVRVVVVEDEGELIGLIVDPARPTVPVRLGQIQPSSPHPRDRG